jgi:hypothetical protein
MVGSGETTATLGAADGTADGLGTDVDDPHAVRIRAATIAAARTSLFIACDSEGGGCGRRLRIFDA